MEELVYKKLDIKEKKWKKKIENQSVIPYLQEKLDQAEKNKTGRFEDFTDLEMLQWFLYRSEHLLERQGKSKRTIEEYKKELTLFIEQLLLYSSEINLDIDYIQGNSLFKSLAPRHIRRYQEWLERNSPYVKKNGLYSVATLARKTTILRNFLLFLYEEQYVTEPLHTGLKKVTVTTDDRPNRDLGPKEVIQLLDYFVGHNHPIAFTIIHVLTTTGIRNEEFCRLQVKDVKYDSIGGSYYIDVLGKGNKKRQIPLREKTMNSIRMFRYARELPDLEKAHPRAPLFTTNTGKAYTPSYLSQYLTREIKKTNLPFVKERIISPHTFRHAFAIISYQSGANIYDTSRSLGHEKLETTMIYLEKVFARERHAIHKWNEVIFGKYI